MQSNENFTEGLAAEPLTDDGIATLRQVLTAMTEMDADQYVMGKSRSPHVERVRSAVRLLWGSSGEKSLDGKPEEDPEPATYESAGEAEVTSPGFAMMSCDRQLVALAKTGRASVPEVFRLSTKSKSDKEIFIDSRKTIPEGTYLPSDEQTEANVRAQLRRCGFSDVLR